MSKISNSIICIVFGIILLLFPVQASADSSLDGKISMDKPAGWEIVSDGSYYRITDEGRRSGVLEAYYLDTEYLNGYISYYRLGPDCPDECGDFHDMEEAGVFLSGYGDRLVDEYIERKYADENYDSDDVDIKPVKVIKGDESDFLRMDIGTPDDYDEDDTCSIYISHLKGNTYVIFYVCASYALYEGEIWGDAAFDRHMRNADAKVDELERMLKTYRDEGCAAVLLEKTEQRSSFEKFIHREEMEYEDIVVVFGGFAMVLFVLIVIYLAVKVVRDILNEGAKKKARKVKAISETQEFKADSSYERSLKDMLDSGLITKKEYRELKKSR